MQWTTESEGQLCIYHNFYSDTIKVMELAFSESNTTVNADIQYKGTAYKKGQLLVHRNDEFMEFTCCD